MFNFERTEVAELHPMELALLGTGEVTLNAVAAELKMLADAGYIVIDGENYRKGSDLPSEYPAYDHVLVNGLFYKIEEVSLDLVPMIVAHGVKESLRYLTFETAKVSKEQQRKIYDYAKKITDTDNLSEIFALGKANKYKKQSADADFGTHELILHSLVPILTPKLDIIGKAAAGTVESNVLLSSLKFTKYISLHWSATAFRCRLFSLPAFSNNKRRCYMRARNTFQ